MHRTMPWQKPSATSTAPLPENFPPLEQPQLQCLLQKNSMFLAPSIKHHLKMRRFETSKSICKYRELYFSLYTREPFHHCPSDHYISPRTDEPILAQGHPYCGFRTALLLACTLAAQDVAEKKPVPNCTLVSSSAQQGVIANQILIK